MKQLLLALCILSVPHTLQPTSTHTILSDNKSVSKKIVCARCSNKINHDDTLINWNMLHKKWQNFKKEAEKAYDWHTIKQYAYLACGIIGVVALASVAMHSKNTTPHNMKLTQKKTAEPDTTNAPSQQEEPSWQLPFPWRLYPQKADLSGLLDNLGETAKADPAPANPLTCLMIIAQPHPSHRERQ